MCVMWELQRETLMRRSVVWCCLQCLDVSGTNWWSRRGRIYRPSVWVCSGDENGVNSASTYTSFLYLLYHLSVRFSPSSRWKVVSLASCRAHQLIHAGIKCYLERLTSCGTTAGFWCCDTIFPVERHRLVQQHGSDASSRGENATHSPTNSVTFSDRRTSASVMLSSRECGNFDHGRISGVTSLHCAENGGEIDLSDLEMSSPVPDEIWELRWGRWESEKARNWTWCIATNGWIRFFAWHGISERRIYRVAELPSGSLLSPGASGVNKQRQRWITDMSNCRVKENCREAGPMSVPDHNCQYLSAVESAFQIDPPDVESMPVRRSWWRSLRYSVHGRAWSANATVEWRWRSRASEGSELTASADGVGPGVCSCRWSRSGGEIVVVLFNLIGDGERGARRWEVMENRCGALRQCTNFCQH